MLHILSAAGHEYCGRRNPSCPRFGQRPGESDFDLVGNANRRTSAVRVSRAIGAKINGSGRAEPHNAHDRMTGFVKGRESALGVTPHGVRRPWPGYTASLSRFVLRIREG